MHMRKQLLSGKAYFSLIESLSELYDDMHVTNIQYGTTARDRSLEVKMKIQFSKIIGAKHALLRVGVIVALITVFPVFHLSSQTIPAGTTLRIRFLEPILSGRASVHGEIRVQTLAALQAGVRVVVPAFTSLMGTIATSRAGRTALQRGSLRLVFDSVQVQSGQWLSLSAVLDSLEWSPRRVKNGTAFSGRKTVVWLAGERLALLAAGVAAAPAEAVEAEQTVRDRSRVSILPGEEAVIRLVRPLVVPAGFPCDSAPMPIGIMELSQLAGRASDQSGRVLGDPVNILFLGRQEGLEKAFAAADWHVVYRSTKAHLIKGVIDAVLERQDLSAPVSPQYYDGHLEDLAFERASPSARIRHHVRFWRTDSTVAGDTVWVGAANQDIGLLIRVGGIPTHRIDSLIDLERELVVRELQAGECIRICGYARLPGTTNRGVNASGQRFLTDQLAVVVKEVRCGN